MGFTPTMKLRPRPPLKQRDYHLKYRNVGNNSDLLQSKTLELIEEYVQEEECLLKSVPVVTQFKFPNTLIMRLQYTVRGNSPADIKRFAKRVIAALNLSGIDIEVDFIEGSQKVVKF